MTLNEEKAEHLSCWSQDKVGETKLTPVGDLAHVTQVGPAGPPHAGAQERLRSPLSRLLCVSPGPTS